MSTRRIATAGLTALVLVLAAFFFIVPGIVDRQMNVRLGPSHVAVEARAESLHRRLWIADLHGDALLWGRPLLDRADHGHLDVPRLLEGNVALQVFGAVTKTPKGINYERNSDSTDNITLLAIAQRWPPAAFGSLRKRAQFLARRLHEAAAASEGRLVIVRSRSELASFRSARERNPRMVAGLLATEGLHPIEGDLANLDTLFAAGYRMFGLTHFFDNPVAGSAHGVARGGLTPLGRRVIERAAALGALIDVAHASPQAIDDVLAITTRPIVVSHTGVQATCPGPRNLSDDQLRRIAATGGVIGIGFWDGAVCDPSPASIAKAIVHALSVAGPDAVALGSDWDGATKTVFDAAGLPALTEALLRAGLPPETIGKVMGGNVLRLLGTSLP
ncbi:MAG: dipeptidase [Gemmatimonadaceae bacterium]|nr:dipeptidase [Gemmatimonadaceae bacterium]